MNSEIHLHSEGATINITKPKCRIFFTPDFIIYSQHAMPNRFKRFMIKLFFGFTYEKVD